jgi:hypothetical protein
MDPITPRSDEESGKRHDEALPDSQEAISHHGAGAPRAKVALGASEEQVNLRLTVPQRVDSQGSKVEDIAGTGGHDSQGG